MRAGGRGARLAARAARAALVALTVVAGLVFASARPAAAIETDTFGIDVVQPTDDGRLHIPLRVDRASARSMRVWNKTDRPVRLTLSVVGARLGDDGAVSLGGDDRAAAWVRLRPDVLELEPGVEATVEVSAESPSPRPGRTHTVAVLVSPEAGPGQAVLQRLALTAFLEPAGPSLVESLGPWPWVAAAVLVAVAVASTVALRRRAA